MIVSCVINMKCLLRQLFHIRQTTTVTDYVEWFTLVDQLKAYTSTTDMLYYTTHFVNG